MVSARKAVLKDEATKARKLLSLARGGFMFIGLGPVGLRHRRRGLGRSLRSPRTAISTPLL